jgi:acyl carrier protein
MEIEQEFDIDVPINMLSDVDTIEDVVELVGSRVKGR